ncbi:MAG: glycosyltransferase [Oscillatoriales cyanobacterium SM2_2_1]|nr:glycosyltransferase [Oscillatoriales cyanobacterium SM2_2_1]
MALVSIVIPLHNKAGYIYQTLESVRSQILTDWEAIVVENGSTDGSAQIVQDYGDRHSEPRLRLVTSPRNGVGAARNFGLTLASGPWVQFLDADDLLLPDHLSQLLATAATHPAATVIAGSWQEFPDAHPDRRSLKHPTPLEVLGDASIAFPPWAVHAAIVRRELLTTDHLWPEPLDHIPSGEDIAFWFVLIQAATVAYSTNASALYRVEMPQSRTQSRNASRWFAGIHTALQWNVNHLSRLGRAPNATQCRALMQVYCDLYTLAQQQGDRSTQQKALPEATLWLDNYFRVARERAIAIPLSQWVRHWLGLGLFLSLNQQRSRLQFRRNSS